MKNVLLLSLGILLMLALVNKTDAAVNINSATYPAVPALNGPVIWRITTSEPLSVYAMINFQTISAYPKSGVFQKIGTSNQQWFCYFSYSIGNPKDYSNLNSQPALCGETPFKGSNPIPPSIGYTVKISTPDTEFSGRTMAVNKDILPGPVTYDNANKFAFISGNMATGGVFDGATATVTYTVLSATDISPIAGRSGTATYDTGSGRFIASFASNPLPAGEYYVVFELTRKSDNSKTGTVGFAKVEAPSPTPTPKQAVPPKLNSNSWFITPSAGATTTTYTDQPFSVVVSGQADPGTVLTVAYYINNGFSESKQVTVDANGEFSDKRDATFSIKGNKIIKVSIDDGTGNPAQEKTTTLSVVPPGTTSTPTPTPVGASKIKSWSITPFEGTTTTVYTGQSISIKSNGQAAAKALLTIKYYINNFLSDEKQVAVGANGEFSDEYAIKSFSITGDRIVKVSIDDGTGNPAQEKTTTLSVVPPGASITPTPTVSSAPPVGPSKIASDWRILPDEGAVTPVYIGQSVPIKVTGKGEVDSVIEAEYFIDSSKAKTNKVTIGPNGEFSNEFLIPPFSILGSRKIKVRLNDKTGNTPPEKETILAVGPVDLSGAREPGVSIQSPSSTEKIGAGFFDVEMWISDDRAFGAVNVTIQVGGGVPITDTIRVDKDGFKNYTKNTYMPAIGDYLLEVTVVDDKGNTVYKKQKITVVDPRSLIPSPTPKPSPGTTPSPSPQLPIVDIDQPTGPLLESGQILIDRTVNQSENVSVDFVLKSLFKKPITNLTVAITAGVSPFLRIDFLNTTLDAFGSTRYTATLKDTSVGRIIDSTVVTISGIAGKNVTTIEVPVKIKLNVIAVPPPVFVGAEKPILDVSPIYFQKSTTVGKGFSDKITVQNRGKGKLTISEYELKGISKNAVTVQLPNSSIGEGEQAIVKISSNPATEQQYFGSIVLKSNGGSKEIGLDLEFFEDISSDIDSLQTQINTKLADLSEKEKVLLSTTVDTITKAKKYLDGGELDKAKASFELAAANFKSVESQLKAGRGETPEPTPKPSPEGDLLLPILIVVIIAIAGGAAFFVIKKQRASLSSKSEYNEEEEEYEEGGEEQF